MTIVLPIILTFFLIFGFSDFWFFGFGRWSRYKENITEIITKCSDIVDTVCKLLEWSWRSTDIGARTELAHWLLSMFGVRWSTVALVLWEGRPALLPRWLFTAFWRSMPTVLGFHQRPGHDCRRTQISSRVFLLRRMPTVHWRRWLVRSRRTVEIVLVSCQIAIVFVDNLITV